jgi:hypothetical protein
MCGATVYVSEQPCTTYRTCPIRGARAVLTLYTWVEQPCTTYRTCPIRGARAVLLYTWVSNRAPRIGHVLYVVHVRC